MKKKIGNKKTYKSFEKEHQYYKCNRYIIVDPKFVMVLDLSLFIYFNLLDLMFYRIIRINFFFSFLGKESLVFFLKEEEVLDILVEELFLLAPNDL